MAVKSLQRAQERIEIRDLKLNALLEVTQAINSNVSKIKLFEIYEKALRELSIDKLVLFIVEKKWDVSLSFGLQKSEIKIDVETNLLPIKEITEVNNQTSGPFSQFDIVVPVFHKKRHWLIC